MKPNDKLISVIIPTFNRRSVIMDAVRSVLAQGREDLEVIVVDDGSTDGTCELFHTCGEPLRYIYQENGGVSTARNRGVAESQGKLLAFLDSDDVWAPGKLTAQINLVQSDSIISFQGVEWFVDKVTDEVLLDQISSVIWPRVDKDGFLPNPMLAVAEGQYLHVGSMLCTRQAFMHVGEFDPTLSMGEDEDWFSRASVTKKFHYTPAPYLRRRFHANQMEVHSEDSIKSHINVIRNIMERTARLDRRASSAASKRLAGKLSHLASILSSQARQREALDAMYASYGLTPLNVPRLAKLMLMSVATKRLAV